MYETVKASINLHAILRNMEDLCRLDDASAEAVGDRHVSIRFSVPEIDRLVLTFRDQSCHAGRGDEIPYNMNLRFSSPEHLNLMVEGVKNPIPTKGFSTSGFSKTLLLSWRGNLRAT